MRHLVRDVLEEETGVVPGWIENGGLFIASTKERLDEYKRLGTVSAKILKITSLHITLHSLRNASQNKFMTMIKKK